MMRANPPLQRTTASVAALPLAFAAERQYRWTDRMSEPSIRAVVVMLMLAAVEMPSSRAKAGDAREDGALGVVTLGALGFVDARNKAPAGWGGEAALLLLRGERFWWGATLGYAQPHRASAEVQLGTSLMHEALVFGLDPGVVVDLSGQKAGFQATAWVDVTPPHGSIPSPLFPFARVVLLPGEAAAWQAGVFLKVPIHVFGG